MSRRNGHCLPLLVALATLCCGDLPARGQLPPLPQEIESAVLPAWVSRDDAELSGRLLYVWPEEAATQALHVIGQFKLRLGRYTLQSQEAVIWLKPITRNDTSYQSLEVYLWREAEIQYPGGVHTSGTALFATINTTGKIRLSADKHAAHSNAESLVYQDGRRIRDAYRAGRLNAPPDAEVSPLTTVDLGLADKTPPSVSFRGDVSSEQIDGEIIATAVNGFFLSRGTAGTVDYSEIQSESAVLFLGERSAEAQDGAVDIDLLGAQAKGVYLEGDVRLIRGERIRLRADKVYYDLENDRALIVDPIMRLVVPDRPVPIYVRASEARQLSSAEFSARNAKISTSEFHTPHYHIGAEQLYFASDTVQITEEQTRLIPAGQYEMKDTTFNLSGWPVLYWPANTGNFREGETAFRSFRTGYDDIFGFQLETRWRLFPFLFGRNSPPGLESTYLDLGHYSDRGPFVGVDSKYELEESYGLFRGYYIYDDEDRDTLGGDREPDIDHPNRGRATLRHRWYFAEDWDLTLEGSYISDRHFLEQYFEREFDTEKPQETYAQLRRQRDIWSFTLTTEARILNWVPTTERLPEGVFRLTGKSLGPATLFSEARAGVVRYRPDENRIFISEQNAADNRVRSGAVLRADTRQEIEYPLTVGPLKLVPFAMGRGTWWDDTPGSGSESRAFGMVGLRASTYLWRIYDVRNSLLDLSGLRHIVKVDFTGWLAASNTDSDEVHPFDEEIEEIDDFSGATFGIRQRWQTKRGAPGRERVTDWLLIDIEGGFFDGAQGDEQTNGYASYTRPEESITSNYIAGKVGLRLSDTTIFLGDANFNTDSGNLDIVDLSVAVERSPRFSYFAGWRTIDEIDSNLFGFGFHYRMTLKHTIGFRSWFDLDRGETGQAEVAYIRRFPRWYAAFIFEVDEITDNTSVSVAVWPEGFPGLGVGSSRYTGLATSTVIDLEAEE